MTEGVRQAIEKLFEPFLEDLPSFTGKRKMLLDLKNDVLAEYDKIEKEMFDLRELCQKYDQQIQNERSEYDKAEKEYKKQFLTEVFNWFKARTWRGVSSETVDDFGEWTENKIVDLNKETE